MRADSWSGLVTNASPYALPPGAAVEQWNLSCNIPGQLTTRGGMRPVRLPQAVSQVMDCYPLEVDGTPALLVLRENGNLEVLSSPAYGPMSAAPVEPAIAASAPNVATTYTGRYTDTALQNGGTVWESLPDTQPDESSSSSTGFVVDGGRAGTAHFPLFVDANSACEASLPLDGGSANYQGDTSVTELDFCASELLPPDTAGSAPTAPSALSVVFGAESAALSWSAPASNGGHEILGYDVQISLDGINWGSQPSPPLAVTASFGDASASLSWSAPLEDGGAAVDGYQVVAEASTNGGITWTSVSL